MLHAAALALALLTQPDSARAPDAAEAPADPPTLVTRFAADMHPDHPLPEHPRPLLVRDSWLNLNGRWDYAITDAPGEGGTIDPDAPPLDWHESAIVVPFPIESILSGVQQPLAPNQTLWYRRQFSAADILWPRDDNRLLLHFGAVDYHATIYLNGHKVGDHTGGYDPFTLDLTEHLSAADPQELIVRVTDPTDTSFQPRGKQTLNPHGIWYTAVSGIWQTAWLEAVPQTHIERVVCTPRPTLTGVRIAPWVQGAVDSDIVRITVRSEGQADVVGETPVRIPLTLEIPNARRWSPADPHLYDMAIEIVRENQVIDSVNSYFALRTVDLQIAPDGFPRIHLNGKPIFLLGPLDQGWWPDGLYTAPTDEALRFDIEQTLAMGFNCARKHVKVEPQRWYYWADRLGLLVLQDMPSGDGSIGPSDPDLVRTPESAKTFEREYVAMWAALHNHPSIIAWIPFNEGWGQFMTNQMIAFATGLDPTRLIDGPSGWTDRGQGHLIDAHVYPGPGMLPPQLPDPATNTPARASFLGEFGGLGLVIDNHFWKRDGSWGYRTLPDAATLERDYAQLIERLRPLIARGLAGAIYTQTTDVELEVNGLLTYDRAVSKIPIDRLAQINARAFLPPPLVTDIAQTSESAPTRWRYSLQDPEEDWVGPNELPLGFGGTPWRDGFGGFGTEGTPGAVVRTRWDTSEIWLRREFEYSPPEPPTPPAPTDLGTCSLRIHHDEDVQVYLNGSLIYAATGYQTGYIDVPIPGGQEILQPGTNVLAIHCTQTRGGQYIDAGIILTIDPAPAPAP